MITLTKLSWSNAFSYGSNNSINFTDSKLIQLLGANGNGKSSIALILEEILFNKNSKGIKKSEVINRYTNAKFYTITLEFIKNDTEFYRIETKRGSTQQVKLFLNDEDISSHTSTGTYKLIEEILGFDNKTFCQIVYQSNSSNLEFLTSPDTARKKFLIELLNLSKYTKIGELFKQLASDTNKELITIESKIGTLKQWIAKYNDFNFSKLPINTVPKLHENLIIESNEISSNLDSISSINKKIIKNNTYIKTRDSIEIPDIPAKPDESLLKQHFSNKITYEKCVTDAIAFKNKMSALKDSCPTCLQTIDKNKVELLLDEQNAVIASNKSLIDTEIATISDLENKLKSWKIAKATHEEWEKLHQLIDTSLPTIPLDEESLLARLSKLQADISDMKDNISSIEKQNKENSLHNNKIDIIKTSLIEMNEELDQWVIKLSDITDKLFRLNTLAKTFSTTGLVAYKIENLSKDLEDLSNAYLTDLSDGRFLISFQITGTDKLAVVITDYGKDIQIEALSRGELTRVNVAVLLAIRKLMQSISESRINLLFLDETISALDIQGKEKLVEVLLLEDNLNTILVSHEFTHPLIEKILVEKNKEVSILIKE